MPSVPLSVPVGDNLPAGLRKRVDGELGVVARTGDGALQYAEYFLGGPHALLLVDRFVQCRGGGSDGFPAAWDGGSQKLIDSFCGRRSVIETASNERSG